MSERRPRLIDMPLQVTEGAVALWSAYNGTVTVVWPEPYEMSEYRVYKNGEMIASSNDMEFKQPRKYDNDKHTNLFFRSSNHKLCYEDYDVEKFTHYKYQVIAIKKDDDNNEIDKWTSQVMEVYTE